MATAAEHRKAILVAIAAAEEALPYDDRITLFDDLATVVHRAYDNAIADQNDLLMEGLEDEDDEQ